MLNITQEIEWIVYVCSVIILWWINVRVKMMIQFHFLDSDIQEFQFCQRFVCLSEILFFFVSFMIRKWVKHCYLIVMQIDVLPKYKKIIHIFLNSIIYKVLCETLYLSIKNPIKIFNLIVIFLWFIVVTAHLKQKSIEIATDHMDVSWAFIIFWCFIFNP